MVQRGNLFEISLGFPKEVRLITYAPLRGEPQLARMTGPVLGVFEVVQDWGNYVHIELTREAYHKKMVEFVELLNTLADQDDDKVPFFPAPEEYRQEMLFFARLFADLSDTSPDYDALARQYWSRVYAIYDHLPQHVDPRPKMATDGLIRFFREWKEGK